MLHYQTIPVTPFAQNCSIVWCSETYQAAIIDPGGDLDKLEAALRVLSQAHPSFALTAIWLTHAHIDHAGGTAALARAHNIPIIGPHEDDQFWIDALPLQSERFGFEHVESFTPTRWLHDKDLLTLGNCQVLVRHCPGHTPGHVVFYESQSRRAFVGDVLFAGGIGRTDFPRGDYDTLIGSITQRLWPLGSSRDDDTVFISGHGGESSFWQERTSNPFVADGRLGQTPHADTLGIKRYG